MTKRKDVKLWPNGVLLFCGESGRIRTPVSANTAKKVMRRLDNMFPDNTYINDYSTDDLTKFCLSGKNPAPSTIKQRRAWCRSMFEWWAYRGYCDKNPASDLKFTVVTGTGTRRVHTWLTQEQIRQAYLSFDASNPVQLRNRLMFLVGVMTGMRASEVVSLRWDMFDADFRSVLLRTKGDKLGRKPIPDQLRRELLAWRERRPVGAQAVFPGFRYIWDPRTLQRVPMAFWDSPVTDSVLTTVCRDITEKIGVKVRPHDLRRTYAENVYEHARKTGGADPLRVTQEAMGHSNAVTTQRYLAKNPARLAEALTGFSVDLGF